MPHPGRQELSAIVPARNPGPVLGRCLRALRRELGPGAELLLVDDRSEPPIREAPGGARVLRLPPGRGGAAAARNFGASRAAGELLLFVDADVELLPGSLAPLLAALGDPAVDAAVGVYAPCPAGLGPLSRGKDAAVRLAHAAGGNRVRWFWTAFGLLRARVFRELGGFDERLFRGATVEDIELGFRLSSSGHAIVQVAAARALHHHRLGLADLLRNDYRKARDWTRALRRHGYALARSHASSSPSSLAALPRDAAALAREEGTSLAVDYLAARLLGLPAALAGTFLALARPLP